MTPFVAADRLLTPGEVAKVFGVHVRTVIHWADNGRLASQRTIGGHRRFREADVRVLLAGYVPYRPATAVTGDR